jgi:predicted phosphodiesterase
MKWLYVVGVFLTLALEKNVAAVTLPSESLQEQKNIDTELTSISEDKLLREGEPIKPKSSLYEMVPHDVTFDDGSRRLSSLDRVVFYVMGDMPYSSRDKLRLPIQMKALESRAEFVVHLGDMKDRDPDLCTADVYEDASDMLQESTAPVFVVPGDNDWLECKNKTDGFAKWSNTFARFEEKWSVSLQARYQETRPENFAFVHNGVHFIGLHVLYASFQEEPELYTVVQDDVDWLSSEVFAMQDPNVGAIVIFGHEFPNHIKYLPLYELLEMTVKSIDKPFLYIQGDLHVFTVGNPFPDADNFLLVSVDEGRIADPMEVSVDVGSPTPFKIKRRPVSSIPS